MIQKIKFILPIFFVLLFVLWRVLTTSGEFAGSASIGKWKIDGLSRAEAYQLISKNAQPAEIRISGKTITVRLQPRTKEAVMRAWENNRPSFLERILGFGGSRTELFWDYRQSDLQRIKAVALKKNKPAREGSISWQGKKILFVPGQKGWRVRQAELQKKIKQTLRFGGGNIVVPGKAVSPQILNKKDYWKKHPTQLLVDKSDFRLYRYYKGRLVESYSVAIGMPGFDTPEGIWRIRERSVDPAWLPPDWAGEIAGTIVPGGTPENPLVARWMGIGDGVGIHGTRDIASLGSQASHGCIRMDPSEVRALYEHVPLQTPLLIRR